MSLCIDCGHAGVQHESLLLRPRTDRSPPRGRCADCRHCRPSAKLADAYRALAAAIEAAEDWEAAMGKVATTFSADPREVYTFATKLRELEE